MKRQIDMDDNDTRIVAYLVIVLIFILILVGRLVYLQILQNEDFRLRAQRNSLKSKTIKASRGLILDREGKVLTRNNVGYQLIYVLGKKRKEDPEDIRIMSELSGYDVAYIKKRINNQPKMGYENEVIIVEDLEKETALKMAEKLFHNEKIEIREYNKRYYPEDIVGSHIIGYIKAIDDKDWEALSKDPAYKRTDFIGKRGIEKNYDKIILQLK